MLDDEADKLREELKDAKAANAFLYLALQALGEVVMKMPEWSGKVMKSNFTEVDGRDFQEKVGNLNKMMANAHSCIWDEDGKPR